MKSPQRKLGSPCHVDMLLALANAPAAEPPAQDPPKGGVG